jgi:flagellar motor switch protein FliN/FliY
MNKEDISKLAKFCLTKNSHGFSSSLLEEGFYRFLALKSLNYLTQMNLFSDLSPKLTENVEPINEDCLCIDLKIKINDATLFAKAAITPDLRKSWEKTFVDNPPLYAKKIASTLNLNMRAEIGSVQLNLEEFKQIKCGDFILLDKITYDLEHNKGKTLLYLHNSPMLYAKIKQNKIKILDFAEYFEENKLMQEEKSADNYNLPKEEMQVENVEENITSMQNMPVTITVEAARFKMTLEKLMNLQPGNLLNLDVSPEKGVDISVNGQKIGKAELVNLGETLGIRITELG